MSAPDFSLDDVARYWDDNAAAWAREVGQGHDIAREFQNNPAFLALVGDLRGRQVLDAGCGDGYNTRILARAGAHMSGELPGEWQTARAGSHLYVRLSKPLVAMRGRVDISEVVPARAARKHVRADRPRHHHRGRRRAHPGRGRPPRAGSPGS